MNSAHSTYDITIVGGGIPALFSAVIFSKIGLKVLLVAKDFGNCSGTIISQTIY